MKTLFVSFSFLVLTLIFAEPAMADGCYLCEGGGYVQFTGDDTFEKRKQAAEDFGCKVSGTTGSCNGAKGSVGQLEEEVEEKAKMTLAKN